MGAARDGSDATGGPPGARAAGGLPGGGGPARRGGLPVLARGALVTVLAAACWFGWLAWDTTYQVDADGVASGPYEAWQVAGCVVSLAAVVVLGTVLVGARRTVLLTTVAFTVAWSVTARGDESGLWLVGALLVLVGVALGSTAVAGVSAAVLARRRTR